MNPVKEAGECRAAERAHRSRLRQQTGFGNRAQLHALNTRGHQRPRVQGTPLLRVCQWDRGHRGLCSDITTHPLPERGSVVLEFSCVAGLVYAVMRLRRRRGNEGGVKVAVRGVVWPSAGKQASVMKGSSVPSTTTTGVQTIPSPTARPR
ncbi:hypothetical protein SKAU_G00316690 [Synaphobranchus kaupii]|uniref:Uncharacterized protein n=1 Tax=Synaphobranchus kaupii TaxID=118154 RepID=A0A9Q1ESQ2_SYNKA|nr:hypothetical protein SKAU_G00316690 [Synaphobranchus kaupii]